jgi:transposase, IS5 family
MLSKTEKNPQLNLLDVPLVHIINQEHELCQFAKKIDWEALEKDFASYYSSTGAPSVPLRTMIGLNLLKMVFELGDTAVLDHWLENPYWQNFCGAINFKHQPPCSVSEFNHFRKRIGKDGEDKIKKLAISIFGKARIDKGIKAIERRKKGNRGGLMGLIEGMGFGRSNK